MLPFRSPAATVPPRDADGERWEVDLNGPLGRTVGSETPALEMPDVHTQLHETAKCL